MMGQDRVEERFKVSQAQKDKFEQELEQLDQKISRLRVLYDQYFMGIEKLEPLQWRTEIAKMLLTSRVPASGTTVLRFRFRALQQRFTSYCGYWDRIVRLIEEGRIRRGIPGHAETSGMSAAQTPSDDEQRFGPAEALIAKRRRFRRKDLATAQAPAPPAAPPPASPDAPPKAPATLASARAADPQPAVAPPGPAAAATGRSPGSRPDDFSPAELDGLLERLVLEKQRVGEPTAGLTRAVLEKSVSRIIEKVGPQAVRLRVIEKDGRVSVAAVLKKQTQSS
jgi:hypothetical protein